MKDYIAKLAALVYKTIMNCLSAVGSIRKNLYF